MHLQQIFHSFQNEALKDQKVPQTKSGVSKSTLDLKSGNFKCLRRLPLTTVTQMLLEVAERKWSLKEIAADRQSIKDLQKVQTAFLKCTNTSTWKEAETRYTQVCLR